MIIGNNFIAYSYLLVYIGAVSILFLFILMLINIRISELLSNNNSSIILAFFVGISSYISLNKIISYYNTYQESNYNEAQKLNYVTSNTWDNNIIGTTDISSIGNILYTNYYIWLIITSIILLLAMVGCIAITMSTSNK
jgi:NADH-ubiquinone oxidoreductase chain 6